MTDSVTLVARTIYLAADHAGFVHKETIRDWLESENYIVIDSGAYVIDAEDDFTDVVARAAIAVSQAPDARAAIIFGGSGQGEAMMANRFPGVRATVFYGGDDSIITLSREHNDANVLSIGARYVTIDESKRVIWNWLHGPTSVIEKYKRRNKRLDILAPVKPAVAPRL